MPVLKIPTSRENGIGWWARFQTIDQLLATLPQGRLQLLQLDTSPLQIDLVSYRCEGVEILFGCPSSPVWLQGRLSPENITFTFSLSSHTPCRVTHGYRLSHLTVGGLHHDQEINTVLPENMVYASLRISRQLFRDYLQAIQRLDVDQVIGHNDFLHLPQTLPPLIAYLQQFRLGLRQQPASLLSPPQVQLILDDLIPLLINAIPPGGQVPFTNLSALARYQLAREAEDYITAHLQQPLTLKDLCHAIYCSRRSLFYAFEEVFGVSPMVYLKARRLQAVRSALQHAAPDQVGVMEVARRFGFWSKSHFARDYQQCFGEYPRDTLRRMPTP